MRLRLIQLVLTFTLIFLLSITSACINILEITPTPQFTPTAPLATTVSATPTPTPIPVTETPPTPTSTPVVYQCPEPVNLTPPDRSAFERYPEVIRNYLTQGGNPEKIELLDLEDYTAADLTGDYVPEYIFIYIDPASSSFPPKSLLIIYQCSEGAVNILETFTPQDWSGLELIDTSDITQNGNLELLFAEVTCGAHTCWHTIHVFTWSGTNMVDSVGAEFAYPYPEYLFENHHLQVISYGIGSVGAGPQRPVTTTLAWDGSAITVTHITIGPAKLRFHAFVDGDTALQNGELTKASENYIHVIQDTDLLSWDAFYEGKEETEWLHALARWRLLNLYVIQDDFDAAETFYEDLQAYNSLNAIGYPVTRLSERFYQIIKEGNTINYACSVIKAMPETQLILDFLNSYGYANPHYKAADLCINFTN
jgi:hypothetical protein